MTNQKFFQKKYTLTWLELDSTIITTILTTILLLNIWPRFQTDATTIPYYAYIILIPIFSIPLWKKAFKK